MAETYMFQASPNVPPQKFSDRPVKIGGVKIKPRWAWSEDYRRLAQQSVRHYDTKELQRVRAEKYAQWWVANHWGEHGPVELKGYDLVTKLAAYQEGTWKCPCMGGDKCPHFKPHDEEIAA